MRPEVSFDDFRRLEKASFVVIVVVVIIIALFHPFLLTSPLLLAGTHNAHDAVFTRNHDDTPAPFLPWFGRLFER